MTHPDLAQVSIRPLRDAADCRQAEEIQLAAWGRDARSVSPAHVLLTAAHNGGVVLGAFAGGDDPQHMVGFSWGFLGLRPAAGGAAGVVAEATRLKLCSHQTGVLPAWQGRGVGFRLKSAQRVAALARGLDLVTWTFDPLETPNAQLNIAKLGAVCDTYRVNLYGDGVDGPNLGLPTDRLVVDWWVTSPRVAARLAAGELARPRPTPAAGAGAAEAGDGKAAARRAVLLNEAPVDAAGWPRPAEAPRAARGRRRLRVEVPANFQALKAADPGLALAWRRQVRTLLVDAFAAGYLVTDFLVEDRPRARAFYLLERGADGPRLAS